MSTGAVGIVTATTWYAPFGKMSMSTVVPDDDRLLVDALTRRGVPVERVAWDDPAVDWSKFALCIFKSAWNYPQHADAFDAWLEATARTTQLWNSPAVVRWNLDKRYLDELAAGGVSIVPTVWVGGGTGVSELGPILDEHGWGTFIFKPDAGNIGSGVMRLGRTEVAQAHEVMARAPDRTFAVQPYYGSVETVGELSLVFFGGRYAYAVNKYPPAGEYSIHTWAIDNKRLKYRVNAVLGEANPVDVAMAERALRLAPDEVLYARVDFLRDDGGDYRLSEIEAISPQLFFAHAPSGADLLADAIVRRIE